MNCLDRIHDDINIYRFDRYLFVGDLYCTASLETRRFMINACKWFHKIRSDFTTYKYRISKSALKFPVVSLSVV
jgi:hypothetical protein